MSKNALSINPIVPVVSPSASLTGAFTTLNGLRTKYADEYEINIPASVNRCNRVTSERGNSSSITVPGLHSSPALSHRHSSSSGGKVYVTASSSAVAAVASGSPASLTTSSAAARVPASRRRRARTISCVPRVCALDGVLRGASSAPRTLRARGIAATRFSARRARDARAGAARDRSTARGADASASIALGVRVSARVVGARASVCGRRVMAITSNDALFHLYLFASRGARADSRMITTRTRRKDRARARRED